jgi:hypothetical protein
MGTQMPFNNAAKHVMLDALDESQAAGADFIGIFTLSDPGTGTDFTGTEATGGTPAYARQAVTWAAAASGQKINTGTLTFDLPAGTYGFFGLFNAVSGNTNNYLGYLPFSGNPASAVKGFATVDAADVTANTITCSAHGLANTDRVIVYNVFAETLPAGLTEGTIYFVVGATTDTFQVSLTSGGTAVDITGIGEMYWQEVIPEVFAGQGQLTVAASALVLDATTM